jgi:phosphoenolpyruvate-protein kinase (PTS system EI component)
MIVDGNKGRVILNRVQDPRKISKNQKHLLLRSSRLERTTTLAETRDGFRLTLRANIGTTADIDLMRSCGAEGIGLLRTEVLCTSNGGECFFEQKQYEVFRKIIESAQGLPVVIRLFDFGCDKPPPAAFEMPIETNPLFGARGVRFLFKRKDFCKIHLRAILRASVYGDTRILVPLVSDVQEMEQIRHMIAEVQKELQKEDIPHATRVSVVC